MTTKKKPSNTLDMKISKLMHEKNKYTLELSDLKYTLRRKEEEKELLKDIEKLQNDIRIVREKLSGVTEEEIQNSKSKTVINKLSKEKNKLFKEYNDLSWVLHDIDRMKNTMADIEQLRKEISEFKSKIEKFEQEGEKPR